MFHVHAPFISRHFVLAALLVSIKILLGFPLISILLVVRTKLPITDAKQLVV